MFLLAGIARCLIFNGGRKCLGGAGDKKPKPADNITDQKKILHSVGKQNAPCRKLQIMLS